MDTRLVQRSARGRSIARVLDLDTGDYIDSDKTLEDEVGAVHQLRYQLEAGQRRLSCPVCLQPLVIRGVQGGQQYHFQHRHDSATCPLKTARPEQHDQLALMLYQARKESAAHRAAKQQIAALLATSPGIVAVTQEQTLFANNADKPADAATLWCRPDITATLDDGNKLAVEIQLSPLFISQLATRQELIRGEGYRLLWVFLSLNNDERERFAQRDIIFSNHRQAFVFSEAARCRSEQENRLSLDTLVHMPVATDSDSVEFEWQAAVIGIDELQWAEDGAALAVDVEARLTELNTQLAERRREREATLQRQAALIMEEVGHERAVAHILSLRDMAPEDRQLMREHAEALREQAEIEQKEDERLLKAYLSSLMADNDTSEKVANELVKRPWATPLFRDALSGNEPVLPRLLRELQLRLCAKRAGAGHQTLRYHQNKIHTLFEQLPVAQQAALRQAKEPTPATQDARAFRRLLSLL